ncbi:Phenylalanine--tRNA ligase beta subunit [Enhygromyxa salina]|uniref:Phenylalanine--tRNA ligase beta subunit n=1 Tax=Enhygromyxa salina TaxID=215803 RepID=A0A2S9YE90_9BACT|nr:phenylalanine--tRNA ligase subunit beta [Enhygromyxa salina]PRQ03321.1 Phenylalanine--tRNA ligase beta subunit [Enhygromyxa salina]
MLISCTWLSELLGRPIDLSPVGEANDPFWAQNIAERLTSLGLEVEGIAYFELPKVIVGRVDAVSAHPDPKATKLNLVELFDGQASVQVVCGASNLPPVGGKVAFAPVGTTLPDGLELSARELRGVASHGMICSEAELDIGGDADGILVLPIDWEPGAELQDLVPGIRDAVIEISVTPNRPDALGHLGVARDLALALGCELQPPKLRSVADAPELPELVEVPASDRCPRYLGYALEGCTVGEAPLWLRTRLHRVGLRALNNVVDITNFVLMEVGQPMHAFDRARLAGERVVVRMAKPSEPITILDGSELELSTDDLVIADAESPQALAGVMGGAGSMVEAGTDRLLLEVAFFEPLAIRRSARRHGQHTDSSHRFERQVDYDAQLELAAGRALALLHDLCGATCVGRCDVRGPLPERAQIELDPAHVGRLLGMDVGPDEVARILSGLGVELDRSTEGAWLCHPPSYRPDLDRDVDLIEEVMRHHGLDDLPARHSVSPEQRVMLPEDPKRGLADALTDGLRARGLHEHVGLAFVAEALIAPVAAEFEPSQLVRPVNPMRSQQACMRPHLLPGLLDAVTYNHAHHARALALFEVGRIYRWPLSQPELQPSATSEVDPFLPDEPYRAAAIRVGQSQSKTGEVARALTDDLLACLARVGLHAQARPQAEPCAWLHPGIQAGLWIGPTRVGVVGELHPDVVAARDLSELELGYGELWLEALPQPPVVQFEDIARFPATTRDLSLDLDQRVSSHEVVAALAGAAASALSSGDDPPQLANADDPRQPIVLLEDYRGEGVEPGRHALLLRLNYRARSRSVTDAEVTAVHDAVVAGALATLAAIDPAARVR